MLQKLKQLKLAEPIAVVGMGLSGKSALKYLQQAGYQVTGLDERAQDGVTPVSLDCADALQGFATAIVSPGIDRRKPAVQQFSGAVINDVELFARLVEKPVTAVTGSNGKSTVVTMLAEVLQGAGLAVRLCGNIGRPVLEALFDAPEHTDVYVLELSSYQLEICPSLHIDVGAVVNVSPDHLDRYDRYADYVDAKANLARQSQVCVLNGDDEACLRMVELSAQAVFYGKNTVNRIENGKIVLNNQAVCQVNQLSVHGLHNYANALVTLLMASALGIDTKVAVETLMVFRGLPHRMRLVAEQNGVRYLDDSKATNIGATAAALAGAEAPVWLIAGGLGKGQDFSELAKIIQTSPVKKVLLIGVDNCDMEQAFTQAGIDFEVCGEMSRAVQFAKAHAQVGDWVLLSPATASFDQFSGYAERGDRFAYEVTSCQ